MNQKKIFQHGIDRRTLLASVTSGITGLAGCASGIDSDRNSSDAANGENETFLTIEWDGPTLIATLASDVSASHVDLVDSNGETFRRDHPRDTSEVAYTLLGEGKDGYQPGEYRLVASDGDSIVDETALSLEPELTITDLKRAEDHPDMEWDKDSGEWENRAALEIENTGTAPSFLESVQWTDAPLSLVKQPEEVEFYHDVLLPNGESTTVYSPGAIYQTQGVVSGRDLECSELDTVDLTATAIVQTGVNPSYSQTVEYGGSQYSCELSVVDGGPVDSNSGGD
ncbi:hypothetical protein [Natrinema salaciae]|uniref:Uncharacterized protein n=1 Tax=Natrinema salaciae TaxID=1186196 RepID=A0A1H9CJB3_9EURY|nr:hypothetical protein [Natrinema salaciae]SEQ01117.1 hypothetical protein SAMN04489841_1066 [Natrinema salaciae]